MNRFLASALAFWLLLPLWACVPNPDANILKSPCTVASDCRTFSNYCSGCACDVLGTGNANPGCDAGTVSCIVDPCYGHTAACDATHHCVLQ